MRALRRGGAAAQFIKGLSMPRQSTQKSTPKPKPKPKPKPRQKKQTVDLDSSSLYKKRESDVKGSDDETRGPEPQSARKIQRRDSNEAAERALLDKFPQSEQKIFSLQNAAGETPVDKVRVELRKHRPKGQCI